MLTQRSIDKIGRHLEDEGWTDDEINTALNELNIGRGVVNVALPLHFKEEALFHAKCHCKYVLGLRESSQKYEKAFEKAYSTYLIEAFENSRGIEGPNSGSHKRGNPAGIEVHAFDGIGSGFIPDTEKKELKEKAPAGLVYMGQDKILQNGVKKISDEIRNKELVKNIVTQYSASVVSIANTFLFAFGGYKTKRKYGGVRIYNQNEQGAVTAENTLEFSRGQPKEKMLEVAYRQITRQLYILTLNSIIAGTMVLDKNVVDMLEKGVQKKAQELWKSAVTSKRKQGEMHLAFVLSRETRNQIIQDFYMSLRTENLSDDQNSPRTVYLNKIKQNIAQWAGRTEIPDEDMEIMTKLVG